MKDVELGYIERLAQKKAISSHLAKTLRKISENRFNAKGFGLRRGSGDGYQLNNNEYGTDNLVVKSKKKTDLNLSAINIEDNGAK